MVLGSHETCMWGAHVLPEHPERRHCCLPKLSKRIERKRISIRKEELHERKKKYFEKTKDEERGRKIWKHVPRMFGLQGRQTWARFQRLSACRMKNTNCSRGSSSCSSSSLPRHLKSIAKHSVLAALQGSSIGARNQVRQVLLRKLLRVKGTLKEL